MFLEIQMPELLYKSLAAKLVLGMPFKVYSYPVYLMKKLYLPVFCGINISITIRNDVIQDLATVDSILLRELPPVDDDDGVRALSFDFITLGKEFCVLSITHTQLISSSLSYSETMYR